MPLYTVSTYPYHARAKLHGEDLTLEELRGLIAQLQKTADLMEAKMMTQDQLNRAIMILELGEHLPNIEWEIDPNQDLVCWNWEIKQRHTKRSCVYFLRNESMPGLIKIGQTTCLVERTKAIGRELNNYETYIKAIAWNDNHERLELLIHALMDDFREEGEWFLEQPVLAWIKRQI